MLNPRANHLFLVKGIWLPCVPTKATFSAWEAARGRVLTVDKLQRRGWHLPNAIFVIGTRNPSIISCYTIRWSAPFGTSFSPYSVSLGSFQKLSRMLSSVGRAFLLEKTRRKVWKSVPICNFWTVWKKRNHIAFRDRTMDVQKLKHSFVSNLWNWNSLYIGEESSSLIGFLEWLVSC